MSGDVTLLFLCTFVALGVKKPTDVLIENNYGKRYIAYRAYNVLFSTCKPGRF